MRILNAHFIGLRGIYNKSQIKEINIDFTKCIHDLIIIVGKNGSGKSTLMNVLTPLPDDPEMYLDKISGLKEIIYFDNGNMYKVVIQYPLNSNGKRGQTKAFLKEIQPDGTEIELNSNGNIGSYKDSLFSKFNLDPNFVSLSQLSIEDRGIVDKKPSERKKYVAGMLESTEVYNNIYKALVKRSSIFKSMINSITAKIDSIGDEEKLTMEMNSLISRLNFLNTQKDAFSAQLSKATATVELLDPNGSIQNLYSELLNEYNTIINDIKSIESILLNISLKSENEALDRFKKLNELKATLAANIDVCDGNIRSILVTKEDEMKAIQLKQNRISTLSMDIDMDSLKRNLTESRKKIFEYENMFKKIGLEKFEISKEEYVSGIHILSDLREMVLTMRSYASESNIQIAINNTLENASTNISELTDKKIALEEQLVSTREKLQYYNGLLTKLDILNGRPNNCNIDTCTFIKDALSAKREEPEKNISICQSQIETIQNELIDLNNTITNAMEVNKVINDIKIIIRSIYSNNAVLNKLPNGKMFSDINEFLLRLSNGDNFNDIKELYNYIDYGNYLELYKMECNKLKDLETTFELNKGKADMIKELSNELSEMMNKLNGIEDRITKINQDKLKLQTELTDVKNEQHTVDMIIDRYKQLSTLKNKQNDIVSKLSSVKDSVDKISKAMEQMNSISGQLTNITSEIQPKQDQLDQIKYSMAQLEEYKADLKEYNEKFALIETIKKYSSPTKGGIQMLFMKLYMDRTISMSNQLLSLLFEGQLEILPYAIDENEFKIPCRNKISSMVNDDISSCSTAERSMISMIISFALLHQSSTKYNILRLDEADATLDQENKSQFPMVVHNVQRRMGVEMCLMVSHSSEIDMSEVDIINLSPIKEPLKGNVIFSLY